MIRIGMAPTTPWGSNRHPSSAAVSHQTMAPPILLQSVPSQPVATQPKSWPISSPSAATAAPDASRSQVSEKAFDGGMAVEADNKGTKKNWAETTVTAAAAAADSRRMFSTSSGSPGLPGTDCGHDGDDHVSSKSGGDLLVKTSRMVNSDGARVVIPPSATTTAGRSSNGFLVASQQQHRLMPSSSSGDAIAPFEKTAAVMKAIAGGAMEIDVTICSSPTAAAAIAVNTSRRASAAFSSGSAGQLCGPLATVASPAATIYSNCLNSRPPATVVGRVAAGAGSSVSGGACNSWGYDAMPNKDGYDGGGEAEDDAMMSDTC